MSRIRTLGGLFGVACLLASSPVRADLAAARAAFSRQDFARAFELYLETARLGRIEGQENVAAMYVGGEGVKRNNVLGYAWAAIATENGGGPAMKSIVDQIQPHLTDAARARVAELQAQYGKAALEQRLYPVPHIAGTSTLVPETVRESTPCTFQSAANPDNYYPPAAVQARVSGNVFVDYTVAPDGRARNPRIWYALPALVFDEAARMVIFNSTFQPRTENGVAVPCQMRILVKFTLSRGGSNLEEGFGNSKQLAEAGDPNAQLVYGLLLAGRPELNKERISAVPWFLKAAQAGIPPAQFLVGSFTLSGAGAVRDEAKAVAWLELAAAAGQADAQVTLANYLLQGERRDTQVTRAVELLGRAADSGSRDGKFYLAALLAAGPNAARRDPARALELMGQVSDSVEGDPTSFEIRAAAHAMLGDFDKAQELQTRAIRNAARLGWNPSLQRARLADYKRKVAWSGDLFAF
jgi:uncharacterized protein